LPGGSRGLGDVYKRQAQQGAASASYALCLRLLAASLFLFK
jgi:hypothetical protein